MLHLPNIAVLNRELHLLVLESCLSRTKAILEDLHCSSSYLGESYHFLFLHNEERAHTLWASLLSDLCLQKYFNDSLFSVSACTMVCQPINYWRNLQLLV